MALGEIVLLTEELKGLEFGELNNLDFDEGAEIPSEAYLRDINGNIQGIATIDKGPCYVGGGKISCSYRVEKAD
ncbi:hypothetical protein HOE04_00700 [archaeon]|jgi:hypothetical protein|nr:hypothetical protein [archaeon]